MGFTQELNCSVSINDDQLEGASFSYLTELKPRVEEYLNEYRWTEHSFQEVEQIECQIQIIFEQANNNYDYTARAIISVKRPVFGTTIRTTSVILSDELWAFNYPQGHSLIHDELQFDELTGLLDFYAYLILGYDFDSFSPLGGTPYFEKAQNVIELAQTTSALGWSRASNNRRNRVTLVNDLLNSSYSPLRRAFYQYHRQGLDVFLTNESEARANILVALTSIRDTRRRVTNNYLFDIFFNTKAREIAGIFLNAPTSVRIRAYNILSETDPSHLSEYSELQN